MSCMIWQTRRGEVRRGGDGGGTQRSITTAKARHRFIVRKTRDVTGQRQGPATIERSTSTTTTTRQERVDLSKTTKSLPELPGRGTEEAARSEKAHRGQQDKMEIVSSHGRRFKCSGCAVGLMALRSHPTATTRRSGSWRASAPTRRGSTRTCWMRWRRRRRRRASAMTTTRA